MKAIWKKYTDEDENVLNDFRLSCFGAKSKFEPKTWSRSKSMHSTNRFKRGAATATIGVLETFNCIMRYWRYSVDIDDEMTLMHKQGRDILSRNWYLPSNASQKGSCKVDAMIRVVVSKFGKSEFAQAKRGDLPVDIESAVYSKNEIIYNYF